MLCHEYKYEWHLEIVLVNEIKQTYAGYTDEIESRQIDVMKSTKKLHICSSQFKNTKCVINKLSSKVYYQNVALHKNLKLINFW